jgi:hypothetical protein
MHSFHHSRGRILFEVACALTISASCVSAWMDLGTLAFLPAAAVTALYALVRLFDMRGRKPAVAGAAPALWMEAEVQGDLLAYVNESPAAPVAGAEDAPVAEPEPVVEPEPVAKAPPKKRSRPRKAKPVEPIAQVAEAEPVEEEVPVVQIETVDEETPAVESEPTWPEAHEEPEDHPPVTPLFEPEPFVRQQRAVFGRKAG